jgi:hypothetical protein
MTSYRKGLMSPARFQAQISWTVVSLNKYKLEIEKTTQDGKDHYQRKRNLPVSGWNNKDDRQ